MASSPESDTGFSTGSSSESAPASGEANPADDADIQSISSDVAVNGRLTALQNRSRDHSVVYGSYDSTIPTIPTTMAGVKSSDSDDVVDNDEERKRPERQEDEVVSSSSSGNIDNLPQYEENEIIFEEPVSPHSTGSGVFGSSVWNVQALPDEYIDTFSSAEEDYDDGEAELRRQRAVWYTRFFRRRLARQNVAPERTSKKQAVAAISPANTVPETPLGANTAVDDISVRQRKRQRRRRKRHIPSPWDRSSRTPSRQTPPLLPLEENEEQHTSTGNRHRHYDYPNMTLLCFVFCICCILFAALVLGISYFGTRWALQNLDLQQSGVHYPSTPVDSHSLAPATLAPTASPFFGCDPDLEFLLELRLTFDARPAEVGVLLVDDVPFGAALWEFNQGRSFRSFSQFLRRNIFAVCLSRSSGAFRLSLIDRGGDGLRATFGSGGTTVFGAFAVAVDGVTLATYNGDCGAQPFADDCGSFCLCEYKIENRRVDGSCDTSCDG